MRLALFLLSLIVFGFNHHHLHRICNERTFFSKQSLFCMRVQVKQKGPDLKIVHLVHKKNADYFAKERISDLHYNVVGVKLYLKFGAMIILVTKADHILQLVVYLLMKTYVVFQQPQ